MECPKRPLCFLPDLLQSVVKLAQIVSFLFLSHSEGKPVTPAISKLLCDPGRCYSLLFLHLLFLLPSSWLFLESVWACFPPQSFCIWWNSFPFRSCVHMARLLHVPQIFPQMSPIWEACPAFLTTPLSFQHPCNPVSPFSTLLFLSVQQHLAESVFTSFLVFSPFC